MNRVTIFMATVIFMAMGILSAQTFNITGTVVDSMTSTGISGASVTLVEFPLVTATTSSTGAFTLVGTATGARTGIQTHTFGGVIAIGEATLTITGALGAKAVTVDVFTGKGLRIAHSWHSMSPQGSARVDHLWKTPGVYYVKIGIDGKALTTISTGTSHLSIPAANSSVASLAKTHATYTLQVSASTYVSKNIALSTLSADAGTIRMSKYQQQTGVWTSVTPNGVDPTMDYGAWTVQVDPRRPTDLYTQFNSQGIYKSTDYGVTWTKTNNNNIVEGGGGITIADGGAGKPPLLYEGNTRASQQGGGSPGFYRSTDGGVNWTKVTIGPLASDRQDVYEPSVDPYDPLHLLMCGHEQDVLVQSTDGGLTWTSITMAGGMGSGGGTSYLFFIDMGNAAATRNAWLYITQMSSSGTWRTTNGGTSWTQVDLNSHVHGCCQIYQSAPGGTLYMAGVYSALGWGILRSTTLGATWTHVGTSGNENIVFGTSKNIYAMYGWAIGNGTNNVDPNMQIAPQPGTTGWTASATPVGMHNGGGSQGAVTNDGTHNIIVVANWNGGLWRYIEP